MDYRELRKLKAQLIEKENKTSFIDGTSVVK